MAGWLLESAVQDEQEEIARLQREIEDLNREPRTARGADRRRVIASAVFGKAREPDKPGARARPTRSGGSARRAAAAGLSFGLVHFQHLGN